MNKLIIFSGLPGTGKSTLATRLACELHYPLLCIDDFIGEVPENAGFSFWDSCVAMLMDVIETQLKVGLDVIVDSVFMNTDRNHVQELARRYDAQLIPIYVYMSDEKLWEERVTARHEEYPEAAPWENVQHQRQHFREWNPETALFIDSVQPVEQNYQQVLDFVTAENTDLKPIPEIAFVRGQYHG